MHYTDLIYRNFGKLIRHKRIEKQLTQQQLSNRLDISRSSIANIELGNQRIPMHMLYEFSNVLGVKPSELIPDTLLDETGLIIKLSNYNLSDEHIDWIKSVVEKYTLNH